jgi:hypothetical protein
MGRKLHRLPLAAKDTVPPFSTFSSWAREPLAVKVPEITALFWVIKLLTTLMGEATSDYLEDGN